MRWQNGVDENDLLALRNALAMCLVLAPIRTTCVGFCAFKWIINKVFRLTTCSSAGFSETLHFWPVLDASGLCHKRNSNASAIDIHSSVCTLRCHWPSWTMTAATHRMPSLVPCACALSHNCLYSRYSHSDFIYSDIINKSAHSHSTFARMRHAIA